MEVLRERPADQHESGYAKRTPSRNTRPSRHLGVRVGSSSTNAVASSAPRRATDEDVMVITESGTVQVNASDVTHRPQHYGVIRPPGRSATASSRSPAPDSGDEDETDESENTEATQAPMPRGPTPR